MFDNITHLNSIENELKGIGNITIEQNMSIICLVGQGLWKNSLTISKVYQNLNTIPIRMISLGASDTNLSFVISNNHTEDTIKCLHKTFFE